MFSSKLVLVHVVVLTFSNLSCIYNVSFIAETGIKYAKLERVLFCKTNFPFPWSKNDFSACFVHPVATCNANAKEIRNISILQNHLIYWQLYLMFCSSHLFLRTDCTIIFIWKLNGQTYLKQQNLTFDQT